MSVESAYPSTATSDSSAGTHAWSSPGNATAEDGNVASCSLDPSGDSEYLLASDFGFSLPGAATIEGVIVGIKKRASLGTVTDDEVRLLVGGAVVGSDRSNAANWDASLTVYQYGGESDTWGTSLSVAVVRESDFGLALRCVESDASPDYAIADVDYVQITIYYTLAEAPDGLSLVRSVTSARPVRRQSRSSVLMVATFDAHVAAVETFEPVVVQATPARAMPRRASSSVMQIAQMPAAVADQDITSAAPQVVQSAAGIRASRPTGRSTVLTLWPTADAGVCDCEIGGVVIVRVGDYRVEIVDQSTNVRDSLHPFRALVVSAGDYRVTPIDECDC